MMYMSKFMGIYAVIPAAVLLAISFFVMVVLRKVDLRGLKIFGYFVSALLILASVLVFSIGVYMMTVTRYSMATTPSTVRTTRHAIRQGMTMLPTSPSKTVHGKLYKNTLRIEGPVQQQDTKAHLQATDQDSQPARKK